tara:strand:- start:4536 stop:4778 length:243 start_codon:yes stop_codon:yes gene_type:complete
MSTFTEFVNTREPDERINHTTWHTCAVGLWGAEQIEGLEPFLWASDKQRVEILGLEEKEDALANICNCKTFGALQDYVNE